MSAFIPSQLQSVVLIHHSLEPRAPSFGFSICRRRPRPRPCPRHYPNFACSKTAPSASSTSWAAQSSSALNYDKDSDDHVARYIDLRTMKVIFPDEAHLSPIPDSSKGFDNLRSYASIFTDPQRAQYVRPLLFTGDTLPLSDSQKDVVQALLSSRSVFYTSATSEEKHTVFLDIVMRSRILKDCVVYCASTRRSAEAMFSTLCSQLGAERRNEILLDLGDGAPRRFDSSVSPSDPVRVVITSPSVMRSASVNSTKGDWYQSASILFIDSVSDTSLVYLEEILLSLPSRFLVCLLSSHMSRSEQELLPIWVETVQNSTSIVASSSFSPLLNRIERPRNLPLLRAFAYNAAVHQSPVQMSLTILKDLLQQEIDHPDGDFIPNFADSFLHGINLIGAEDPSQLLFSNVEEAAYADVASLVVADAIRTEGLMRTRHRRRTWSRRKERTPASRAAARRRREGAFVDSDLLPAIVLINGHTQTISAALAIISALGSHRLLWDDDTTDHVQSIVDSFITRWTKQLTPSDLQVLDLLRSGIGAVHDMYTPAVRLLVEELFRSGLIPIVIADTHLGSEELCALPSAKSVLVESSSLAICDDQTKGLILAWTAASLSGRIEKDDVGNLIMLWYDESVSDETAGREVASTLLGPVLTGYWNEPKPRNVKPQIPTGRGFSAPFGVPPSVEVQRGTQSRISSSYETVLRSLRRFGPDGYNLVFEYTLSSFKRWLERAALHATLEKVSLEKKTIDKRLEGEDWEVIADFERRGAKVNEVRRIFKAMSARFEAVYEQRVMEELKVSHPGRIIGIKSRVEDGPEFEVEPKLLVGVNNDPKSPATATSSMENADDNASGDDIGSLLVTKDNHKHKTKPSPAVFVSVIDQETDGKRLSGVNSRYLVVCVFGDGVWTLVPMGDVEALSHEDSDIVPNVDLLMMPHPATFDLDPESQWAKCVPVDEVEQASVHRVSDELISRMTSEQRPILSKTHVPEFDAQQQHVEHVEEAHQKSPWFGRDKELIELRRLRRRAVDLGEETGALQKRKDQFEEEMLERRNDSTSIQRSLMAVLEDCHAVGFVRDGTMEMTPIGALASILQCEFPVFAAACLCLIDDTDALSVGEFAAFVAVVVNAGRTWALETSDEAKDEDIDDDEPLDMSLVEDQHNRNSVPFDDEDKAQEDSGDNGTKGSAEAQQLRQFIPASVGDMVVEIQQALHQLHRRHLGECQAAERLLVPEIVPTMLNHRMGMAVKKFAEGATWIETCEALGNECGYGVREMRRVCSVLALICSDEQNGEFSSSLKELAGRTSMAINRWPVRDHDVMVDLLDSGVVDRPWSGNTYDRWWRSIREALKEELAEKKAMKESVVDAVKGASIETAEAEIMETL